MPEGVGSRRSGVDAIEVDDGNFDYEDRIEVEASQKVGKDFWIRAIGGVVNQKGPYTFIIEPMVDRYLQLNRSRLEMVMRIVRADGTAISRFADVVAPVNLLGAVYWKDVVVRLNGQSFDGASNTNAGYKAYMETMLSCDSTTGDSHLNASFYHPDTPTNFDTMAPSAKTITRCFLDAVRNGEIDMPAVPANIQPAIGEDPITPDDLNFLGLGQMNDEAETPLEAGAAFTQREKKKRRRNRYRQWFRTNAEPIMQALQGHQGGDHVNHGFDARYHIVSGSCPWDMYSPITHDFFKLNNHVGPGNRIELTLTPYPDNFLLNTFMDENYKLELVDMKLHLRSIERKERIPPPIREKYLMNQTELHKHLIAANTPNTTFRIHTGGVMPKTIVVGMVSQRAADGMYGRNPFYLQHYFLKKIALVVNGEITPADGLNMNFQQENGFMSKAYSWMFENTGTIESERGNLVSWPLFKGGCFMVPFDMTPDKCNGIHNHEPEYGYIDLFLEFALPTDEPMYVLYEKVYNKVVVNDKLTSTVTFLDVEGN